MKLMAKKKYPEKKRLKKIRAGWTGFTLFWIALLAYGWYLLIVGEYKLSIIVIFMLILFGFSIFDVLFHLKEFMEVKDDISR
jgi:hypothetical protein